MLPHSLFSLPHGIIAILLSGSNDILRIAAVIIALFSARSAANAFNRFADRRLDRLNLRTKNRALPSNRISKGFALHITFLSLLVFRTAVLFTTPVCILLMPFAIAFCLGYSFSKRFTPLCHFWLGLACGLSPLGAYLCLAEKIDLKIMLLFLSCAFQVAGYDMLYAVADKDFDRKYGLFSFPASYGVRHTLITCLLLFFSSTAALTAFAALIGAPLLLLAVPTVIFLMQNSIRSVSRGKLNVLRFNGICSCIILAFFCIHLLNNVF